MLQIRTEQLEAFQPVADAAFVERVTAYLRQEHGGETVHLPERAATVAQLPEALLKQIARRGITCARRYGLTTEADLLAFVVLTVVAAPNFDQHPLVRRVLQDEALAPETKLARLWEETREENWEVIAQQYDAHAWNLAAKEGAS